MKILKSFSVLLLLGILVSPSVSRAEGEIGFFGGGFSKDADIASSASFSAIGDRSWATYAGLTWGNPKFLLPILELEHTLGVAYGADKSVKPHTLVYSATLNIIFPVDMVRLKPFIGGGIGWAYNFGSQSVSGVSQDIAGFLGNNSNFTLNIGGGTKIKLSDDWWMRLTLRDYILPNLKRAVLDLAASGSNPVMSTIKESTHNLSFSVGLAYEY